MPERSRSPEGPRHLAPGGDLPRWWQFLDPRRLAVALSMTFIAMPVLVLDNLPNRAADDAVVAVAPPTTAAATTTAAPTTTAPPTTVATTAPPTTAPPTTALPTTAAPTTTPTTARPRPTTTTAPPATAPPTTAAPPPPSSSSSSDAEATIRATFGAAGDPAVAVARCESGLNPSAHSYAGPGYYGLFQISRDHAAEFQAVTGRSFDDAWDEAGPNSQYAKYLYDRQGWAPWGSCAPG